MDNSTIRWLSEMGLMDQDQAFMQQMNSFDEITAQQIAAALGGNGTVNPKEEVVSPGNTTNPPSDVVIPQGSYMNKNYATKGTNQGYKRASTTTTKPASYTTSQDHVMAERRRREKLSQHFIALSALVPGLTKMDKATVLGDAIKYLKTLQEQVKKLEEQTAKNKPMESVIYVRRTQLSTDDINDSYSSDETSTTTGCSDEPVLVPEIEVRVLEKNVLIRVHCEKRKGVLVKTLAEIEKLHLSILNSNVIPFGDSALDITISALLTDVEYNMTVKDLVKSLRSAFRQFM